MATTSQVTSYRSAGQPDDSVGAVGDICWDTTNRFTWVKQSGNTWVGGAYSNIGPTGPAQLSSLGVPASGFGQIGNGCTDQTTGNTYYRSSSGWILQGNILGPSGAVGAQGFSSLTNQAACYFGQVQSINQTLTSTAQVMQNANSSIPAYVMFAQASAFMGLTAYNNGVATTISLVDTTTNTAVWTSSAIASGTNYSTGTLNATTYPLVANRLYQFMVTGSGTSSIGVNPVFLQPSVQSNVGAGILSGFTTPTGTTFSGTVQYFYPNGTVSTNSSKCYSYTPIRAGGVLGATLLYIPSTTGAAAASCTVTMYAYNQSGSAGNNVGSFTVSNNGVPQIVNLASIAPITTGVTYYAGVTGSGTGQIDVKFQLAV